MTLPERGTPEWDEAVARINKKLMTTVSNIAVRRGDLDGRVQVVVHDDPTQEKYGSFVDIKYIMGSEGDGDMRMVHLTRSSIKLMPRDVSPRHIAEALIKESSDTPLVLDDTVAKELSTDSSVVTWVKKDHYSVMGLSGGTVEVFTPYRSHHFPGMSGIEIFDE